MHIQKIFPFRLVTFDVTNTLLNFKAEIGKTYGDIGAKHGVKCDTIKLTRSFKHQFKKMDSEKPNYGAAAGLSWRKWWQTVVYETFRSCHNNLSDSQLDLIFTDLVELYKTPFCWEPAAGALELLNYLKDRGVSLGVISNTDPRLHDILRNIRLNSFFKFVLSSYEVEVAKPDRRIFERAMVEARLKDLNSQECLHIGDNLKLDYFGAKNVGWNSFLVLKRKSGVYDSGSEEIQKKEIFEDLTDLRHYLQVEWNDAIPSAIP